MIAFADAIDADALRLRHEFMEMPGLVLNVSQVARQCAITTAHAKALLESLETDGFLVGGPGGAYRRAMPHTGD